MAELSTSFIHKYVPSDGNPYTLLLLHGTGGNEDSLLDLGAQLLPGAGLISPRGKVLEYGMPRFFRRFGDGIFDEEDLHNRTAELIQFIGSSAQQYGFDPTRVVAVGYSNGANTAASILLTDPTVLAGAVILRGMIPFEPKVTVNLREVPVLILSGDRDPMVPLQRAIQLAQYLKDAGASVEHETEVAAHALTQDEFQVVRNWLVKHFEAAV